MAYKNVNTRKSRRVMFADTEDLKDINPDNLDLIEDYLSYMKGTGKADTTLTVYRSNLNIFFVWCKNYCKNKDFSEIKKNDYLKFQTYMVSENLSPARIRNVRATLSSLSNYIETMLDEEEKWANFRNIILKIEAPKMAKVRDNTILTDEQCQNFLDLLIQQKKYQKACAFALAWASGRRKSELVRVKHTHIKDENIRMEMFYKTHEKVRTKGQGRNGKMIYIYVLTNKFKPYFDLWMNERRRLGVPDEIEELFVYKGKDGEWHPMKAQTLSTWALSFGKVLNVNFYFHCLRHNFTTELGRLGFPAELIRQIIGWESIDMVSVYDDRDVDDLLESFLNNLKVAN